MGAQWVAFSMIFWVFCKKWQPALGLRLRGQIGVRASCFYSLSLNWCPLFLQRFFDVFLGHPGIPKSAKKPSEPQVSPKWAPSELQVSLKWASSEPQVNPSSEPRAKPNRPKTYQMEACPNTFCEKTNMWTVFVCIPFVIMFLMACRLAQALIRSHRRSPNTVSVIFKSCLSETDMRYIMHTVHTVHQYVCICMHIDAYACV